jgi:hypothetical protein
MFTTTAATAGASSAVPLRPDEVIHERRVRSRHRFSFLVAAVGAGFSMLPSDHERIPCLARLVATCAVSLPARVRALVDAWCSLFSFLLVAIVSFVSEQLVAIVSGLRIFYLLVNWCLVRLVRTCTAYFARLRSTLVGAVLTSIIF